MQYKYYVIFCIDVYYAIIIDNILATSIKTNNN